MSDEDLLVMLEQVHSGRFPVAAPSLRDPETPSQSAASVSSQARTVSPSSSQYANQLADRQASNSKATSSSAAAQDTSSSTNSSTTGKTTAAKIASGPQRVDENAAGADAKSGFEGLPEAVQQQGYRFQAFTRPLMQRMQGQALTTTVVAIALSSMQCQV